MLAYREGLSDERAMDAVRFDLRFKIALDLPVDHPGFHPSSLVRFRARLLLNGKERLVFERSLELAQELGLISGQTEQILDSTPMLGAAAVQDTATLVRSGVRKLIDAVGATDQKAADGLAAGLRFDYEEPRRKPAGDWQDKRERMALLGEVAIDATRALGRSQRTSGCWATSASSRRRGFCARSSVRSSSPPTTTSLRAHVGAAAGRSFRRGPRDAPRAHDRRAPVYRLQDPRRGGYRGAADHLGRALARERARRPARRDARRPPARGAAPETGLRRYPIPPSAITSNASGLASSGCSH